MAHVIAQSILQDALRVATKENEIIAELDSVYRDLFAGHDIQVDALLRVIRLQQEALKLHREHALLVGTLIHSLPALTPPPAPQQPPPVQTRTPWWWCWWVSLRKTRGL